jgi:hypothetical protein
MALRIDWTAEEEAKVRAEYQRVTVADPSFTMRMARALAMTVLPEERRRKECAVLAKFFAEKPSGATPTKRTYKKRTAPEQIAATPPQIVSGVSIADAIGLLCEVIIAQVRATIGPKIESTVASGIVEAARKAAPKMERAADPKNIRAMDALQLRLELIRAKGEGDTVRAAKITAEFSRRESSANAITRESTDEA